MDSNEITTRIRGDWMLFTSEARDLYTMQDFLAFKAGFLKARLKELEGMVDLGVAEYKQTVLSGAFDFIDSLKYDARGFDTIGPQTGKLRYALYISMIQLFICRGTIRIRRHRIESGQDEEKPAGEASGTVDLKTIIARLSERLQASPELKTNPHVKNILMQVNLYKKELAETQRLATSMPQDKKAGLVANFKKRVDEITERANENYLKLLEELEPRPEKPAEGLSSYDLSRFAPLYEGQAKAFAGLASRFRFVEEQRSGSREILLPLLVKKEQYMKLIKDELRAYTLLEPFEGGKRKAAREFTREIVRILQREAEEAFR
jgi:hypothetical protein